MKLPFVLLALILLSTLCNSQRLHGDWYLDIDRTISNQSEEKRQFFDTLPDDAKERIVQSFDGRLFSFEPSGSVTVRWPSPTEKSVNGRWNYSPETTELIIEFGSEKYLYKVVAPEEGQLILEMQEKGGVFEKLLLVKKN